MLPTASVRRPPIWDRQEVIDRLARAAERLNAVAATSSQDASTFGVMCRSSTLKRSGSRRARTSIHRWTGRSRYTETGHCQHAPHFGKERRRLGYV
jgi:hypothetical protein